MRRELAERRLAAMVAEALAWRQEAEALRGHLGALYARLDPYEINADGAHEREEAGA